MTAPRRAGGAPESRAGAIIQRPPREAPPQTAEVAAHLDFPLTGLHLSALAQGPAVMIGRPPPPAAPKSGPPCDRLCHSKVAGQDTACRVVERASSTLRRPKTQDKCQSLRTEGALVEADAIIVGKTNGPGFCYRGVTSNDLWGETRNPHDPSRTAAVPAKVPRHRRAA